MDKLYAKYLEILNLVMKETKGKEYCGIENHNTSFTLMSSKKNYASINFNNAKNLIEAALIFSRPRAVKEFEFNSNSNDFTEFVETLHSAF